MKETSASESVKQREASNSREIKPISWELRPNELNQSSQSSRSLRPISHKDFNEFIKGRGFTNRNDYKLKDLKAAFGFKSLNERIQLVVSSEDPKEPMKPTQFNSMKKAAEAIGIGAGVINYARKRGKKTLKRTIDGQTKIFSVKFFS